ncbi:MFS transporter [Ruicaihuangia caeni]|uniref:MFS transporter n=1 Tax=Ruicaihuangia caeni TaxID=3042517 RepID=UPI0033905E18
MRPSSSTDAEAGRRSAATLFCVFLLFGVETAYAAGLPLAVSQAGWTDPWFVSLLVALTNGVGLLMLPLFIALIDSPLRRALMLVSGVLMAIAAAATWISSEQGLELLLVVAVLVFGIARVAATVSLLAQLAGLRGDATLLQGLNGASQRLGSAVAIAALSSALAAGLWGLVYGVITFAMLLWAAIIWMLRAPSSGGSPRRWMLRDSPRVLLEALRDPRVRASAYLNVVILMSLLVSNSLVGLVLERRQDSAVAAVMLTALIVARDATSVVTGLLYRRVRRRVGQQATLTLIAAAAFVSLAILAFAPHVEGLYIPAFLLHGFIVGAGIATTNLLATHGADAGAYGARLAASQLPAGIALLGLPLVFGVVLDLVGVTAALLALAVAIACIGGLMLSAGAAALNSARR